MQSARRPAARSLRVPATNATLVWFSEDAVKRRRRSTAVSEAFRAENHRPAQVHRSAHLRALFRRIARALGLA
jgi:hypothetical protein